jgi:photosystem II stability/assembly factor-like uncharacterized protein
MIRPIPCLLLAATAALWSVQTTGIDSSLRGISVVVHDGARSRTKIWAVGSNGVVLRSNDSGKNWERLHIPAAEKLDFRGVQAFGENEAYVMASGEREKSGIFKTADGGKNWTKQYSDARKDFFLDAIVCVNSQECFALSDPVDGKFLILHTADGTSWKEIVPDTMPPALAKEGGFAASNSCLLVYGESELYFGTGGPAARVFHSADKGRNWTVVDTPILSGKPSQGIFSIARQGKAVVIMGGDYQSPNQNERIAAYSIDEGRTWKLPTNAPKGFRSALANLSVGFIAVGTTGAEISSDGITWKPAGTMNLNALVSAGGEAWGVGPKGTVVRYEDKVD